MSDPLAWTVAMAGLILGGGASFIPGFPGCAIALLGMVGFAGLTDFQIITQEALVLATGVTLAGSLSQLTAPMVTSRAMGGTAGAATGAAVGAALGSLIPIPGVAVVAAVLGAVVIGGLAIREGVIRWLRGVFGALGGCCLAVAVDLVAVLGLGALLAVADFAHRLG